MSKGPPAAPGTGQAPAIHLPLEGRDLSRGHEERVDALHPDPKKKGTRISREMYEAVREAILDAVPADEPGLRFGDLSKEVEERAPRHVFENASVSWYATTVKLDLEARGLISRVPGVSPQRLVRTSRPEAELSVSGVTPPRGRRARHPMPAFVREALIEGGLMGLFRERPPYQQNDYVGWIAGAKREETKRKRLGQMLGELRQGGVYMRMAYRPKRSQVRGSQTAGDNQ